MTRSCNGFLLIGLQRLLGAFGLTLLLTLPQKTGRPNA
jgi:hypothetical protein